MVFLPYSRYTIILLSNLFARKLSNSKVIESLRILSESIGELEFTNNDIFKLFILKII